MNQDFCSFVGFVSSLCKERKGKEVLETHFKDHAWVEELRTCTPDAHHRLSCACAAVSQ